LPPPAATMPKPTVLGAESGAQPTARGEDDVDIVFLRSLRIETVIGIYDWEKQIKQPVILDIEMASDIAKGAATDRIEDALDYKAVSKRLKQFVGDAKFELVETLAERCAQIIREEFGVPWVRLTLNKTGAVSDADGVGVIIERGERR
jgi:dihydroneopterin aldolase